MKIDRERELKPPRSIFFLSLLYYDRLLILFYAVTCTFVSCWQEDTYKTLNPDAHYYIEEEERPCHEYHCTEDGGEYHIGIELTVEIEMPSEHSVQTTHTR